MTLDSHIQDALAIVEAEQEQVSAKQAAYERFRKRVGSLSVTAPTGQPQTVRGQADAESGQSQTAASQPLATGQSQTATGQPQAATLVTGGSSTGRCRNVRDVFSETVYPLLTESDEGASVLTAIQNELGDSIAVALAPGTDSQFTPQLQQALLSGTDDRLTELRAFEAALKTERSSLTTIQTEVEEITDWLFEVNEQSLMTLAFEPLQCRHQQLRTYKTQCDQLVCHRQETLHGTTSRNATAGLAHLPVVEYLYDDLPVTFPVLSTLCRLVEICTDCQRTLRDHLTRRV